MEKKKDLLSNPILCLKGVGPKNSVLLEKKGIKTILDLFWFLPVRYVEKSVVKPVNGLVEGERASIVARVMGSRSLFFRHSRKKAYEAVVSDGTGNMSVKWFQFTRQYLKKVCKKGNLLILSGNVTSFGGSLQMIHPEIVVLDSEDEITELEAVTPVYSQVEGLKQGVLRTLVKTAFAEYGPYIESTVPKRIEDAYELISLYEAFSKLHLPDEEKVALSPWLDKYRHRLVFEEYFLFQAALLMKKRELQGGDGITFRTDGILYPRFKRGLPFKLTGAQCKVAQEVEQDMGRNAPMNRLLQGDVGSGKTVCALMASCMAIDSGYQVAFMAPTEILAEQHYLAVHGVFQEMGVSLAFLRGSMGSARKGILEDISSGKTKVVIGTHALIQQDVVFDKLGLVIIDEQHRFGVIQRKLLKEKGQGMVEPESGKRRIGEAGKDSKALDPQSTISNQQFKTGAMPDVLIMTATPIPRTLSMVIYGDLDVSSIDEMPEGRKQIWTRVIHDQDKTSAFKIVENELKNGRQAYVVYPLVEESEKSELLNATEMARHLQKSHFPSYKVGLLHGRMKPEDKEEVMGRFKNREIDILVCTTIIEVGIDVANATIIVIEHAERFGLSQIHQLRGRVGRSGYPSGCILITSAKRTALAAKRLKILEETTDGFKIAEEDMRLRGPGDMLGVKQAGLPDFKVGDIVRDIDTMIQARKIAGEALETMIGDDLNKILGKAKERWADSACLGYVA